MQFDVANSELPMSDDAACDRLQASRILIRECRQVLPELHSSFSSTTRRLEGVAQGIIVDIQLSLAGTEKVKRSVSYEEPRGWQDYIKAGLCMRWPWLKRFARLEPQGRTIYIDYDFYEKLCPHLAKNPSTDQCVEWMLYE